MTDRETMYQGLSHAAWGYFFLNFDFNLGTVSIFPRFVGYILFYLAIGKLSGERRDLALLRPLCVLLGVWAGADWCMNWGGGTVDGHVLFLDLLTAAAGLYFQYQFLTDLAALAEKYRPEEGLSRRILKWRAVQTILVTVFALVPYLPARLSGTAILNGGVVVLAVVHCLVGLSLMLCLFTLRNLLRDRPPEEYPGGGTEPPAPAR